MNCKCSQCKHNYTTTQFNSMCSHGVTRWLKQGFARTPENYNELTRHRENCYSFEVQKPKRKNMV